MNLLEIFLWMIPLLLLIGGVGLLAHKTATWYRGVYGATGLVCLFGLVVGVAGLVAEQPPLELVLPLGLPWSHAHFRLDHLTAFFMVVVNLGGAAASLFAMGYGLHEPHPRRILPLYPCFLAAMNLVLVVDDAYSFLLAWECMSLTSWGLVLVEHRIASNRQAAFLYLSMAGFGTMMLLFLFGVLAGQAGDFSFAAFRLNSAGNVNGFLVLFLVLLGAGSKAGLFPLHVWLPLAHPAAPSHVSALMSGVMTKVAVYAALRIIFDLNAHVQWQWSVPVLIIAGITAFIGVLYAIMQHDIKRLLAYHTVENIGIIFLGIGLAMAFRANHQFVGASVAITAALLHTLNHSLFKSLLFLGSGAVLHATGERDIEKLGGLIHRMPVTAFFFLVGSAAISALPPLNGFVSEWLIFQAMMVSPHLPQPLMKFLIPCVGALLALAAALAAACFVKAFGVTFLGRPRSPQAAQAVETDGFSLSAMAVLATLCILIGIFPVTVVDLLQPVSQLLVGVHLPPHSGELAPFTLLPFGSEGSSYDGFLIMLFMLVASTLTAWSVKRFACGVTKRGDAWDCGQPDPSPMTQYTAGSFSQPIRRVFGSVWFYAREKVDMPLPGETRAASFKVTMLDPAWEGLIAPLGQGIGWLSERFNVLHFLSIRQYLFLVFTTLILFLLMVAQWS
ncbi:MAG: hydrogenase 4 subunit B [Magnetococcales bacterium]|nr:hydrogenase 4 subunit B [Magnetococcales bacterium]